MNNLLKYLGAVIQLIGALVLAIPALMDKSSNFTLGLGLLLVILGFVLHIVLNRKLGHE